MATIEFLTDDDIEQLAWLREELYPLPPTPSNDEERKDFIKHIIDENRQHLFDYVPPDTKKYRVEPRHQLTFSHFEWLKAAYLNEIAYRKATDTPLLNEYAANELSRIEHELALLDEPLSKMLYDVFLSGKYKDGRILLDNGVLTRFGVQNALLGANDGSLFYRIAEVWDRVLFKLYLQGEQHRLNGTTTNKTKQNRSHRFVSLMSAEQLDKLYEELTKAGKFLDRSTDKQALIANLIGDTTKPVIWVGGNGELAYFIEKLITNGLLEAEKDCLWSATEQHFVGPNNKRFDNLVRDKQMYQRNTNNKSKPKRGNKIDAIVKMVKEIKKTNE